MMRPFEMAAALGIYNAGQWPRIATIAFALSVFAVSGPAPRPLRAADAPSTGSRATSKVELLLNEVFALGYAVGPKQLPLAQKPLRLLRQELDDNPWLDYSLGLIELRQGKPSAAIGRFEAFIRSSQEGDWPAWQALIWARLVDRRFPEGLENLIEYAELVSGLAREDEFCEAQRNAAQWIGEIVEALSETEVGARQPTRALLEDCSDRIRMLWNDELFTAYEAGREIVRERSLALDWKGDAAKGRQRTLLSESRQRRLKKIADRVEDVAQQRQDHQQTSGEWKQWLDETLDKIDQQLSSLEQDYKHTEKQAQSLLTALLTLEQEAAFVSQLPTGRNGWASATAGGFVNDAQKSQAVAQLQTRQYLSQVEYNLQLARMAQTSREGADLQRTRAQAVRRYEQATGEITKKQSEIARWEQRLNQQQSKLAAQGPPRKPPQIPGKPAPRTLKALVTIDFEAEQRLVYSQFGLQPPRRETPFVP